MGVPNISNAIRVCNESESQSSNNWNFCYDGFLFHVYRVWKRYEPVENTADSLRIADIHIPIFFAGHDSHRQVLVNPTTRKRLIDWNTQEGRGGEAAWNGQSEQYYGKKYSPNDN